MAQLIDTGGGFTGTGDEEADVALPPISGSKRPIDSTFDSNDWRIKVQTQLVADIKDWAELNGVPGWQMDSWLRDEMSTFLHWVEPYVLTDDKYWDISKSIPEGTGAINAKSVQTAFYEGLANPHQPDGLNAIYNLLKQKIDTYVPGFATGVAPKSSGGSGSRAPTAGEIRQQFDLDKLTDDAQSLARAYLVEDHPDPRGIAKAYVDAIVSSGGKQALDYQTFVLNRLKKTARWTTIQRNNKSGVDPLEYVSKYAQAALSALGGNRGLGVSDVVGEGAALAAAPGAFQDRLMREDSIRNQSGFINGLEERLSGVSKILRG